MNTWTPYIMGSACILKGGDRADNRMRELNELIASAKRTASTRSAAIPKIANLLIGRRHSGQVVGRRLGKEARGQARTLRQHSR